VYRPIAYVGVSTSTAIWPTTSVLPTAVVLVHGQPPPDAGSTSLVRRRHWETAFAVAGPRVWNSLPPAIRHSRCQSSATAENLFV